MQTTAPHCWMTDTSTCSAKMCVRLKKLPDLLMSQRGKHSVRQMGKEGECAQRQSSCPA